MALIDYTSLQASIASRLQRDDLTGIIPDFIKLAEVRLSRRLRVSGMESSTTINCVAGTQAYTLPSDYLAIRNITIKGDPARGLHLLTPELADKYYAGAATGKPNAYTVIGDQLYLYDTPDSAYEIEVVYYAKPAELTTSNLTNFYITSTPDAILYASLAEAATHIKDDQALQRWGALYDRAIKDIEEANQRDQYSASNMRVRLA